MVVVPDEESQMQPAPPAAAAEAPAPAALAPTLAVKGGVSLSYRVSLTVEAKALSDTGKAAGGTESKLILDDACGTVAPGQVF